MVTQGATSLQDVTRNSGRRSEILALVVGRVERARIIGAVGSQYQVTFVGTVEELRLALTNAEPAVLVAEPRDQTGAPCAPLLRDLRARRPDLPLIGYCGVSRDESRDIVDLASCGVHELLLAHATDSPFAIQQTVRSAVRLCAGSALVERVRGLVPSEIGGIVDYCLRYPKEATSVATVARALGIHRKTLVNRCARAGVPVPGAVIAWCRLLIAAQLVRSRLGSVETVAMLLEFPSGTALRNMLKRYTQMRPRDVREVIGFERMIDMFGAALGGSAEPREGTTLQTA